MRSRMCVSLMEPRLLTAHFAQQKSSAMHDFFHHFDECYVLNLPSRKDRWRDTRRELAKVGSPSVRRFNAIRPDGPAGFPSAGARGCFLSHLGVLIDAQQRGLTRVLILEDDVSFTPDFSVRASTEIEKLRKTPWGIFYGGGSGSGDVIPPDLAVQTSHMVGIAAPNISGLVTHFKTILTKPPGDPTGGPMHVDGAYSWWYRKQHPNVLTIAAMPPLGFQRSSRSDVHGKWFDSVPFLSEAVALARRFKA